jgi:Fe-S-cluster formation regulator IscX/YfhJ
MNFIDTVPVAESLYDMSPDAMPAHVELTQTTDDDEEKLRCKKSCNT